MTDTIATYNEFLRLTGDATAASNLVLAHALKNAKAAVAESPEGLLNLEEAAAYLGCTVHGLRKVVIRTQQSRAGQHVMGPTIEFSQQRKRGTIRFRREWLDAFIEATHLLPGTPAAPKVRQKSLKPDTAMQHTANEWMSRCKPQ